MKYLADEALVSSRNANLAFEHVNTDWHQALAPPAARSSKAQCGSRRRSPFSLIPLSRRQQRSTPSGRLPIRRVVQITQILFHISYGGLNIQHSPSVRGLKPGEGVARRREIDG
ncbi:hypothetical protein CVT26_013102 [Gymnopilus dilepis]|uniref:Uncharacterized protein n=1 Tax=Gymnopilus dilepis TaxID=231916 RepID=A0A409YFB8_9AGAR|nr:hypothetical protein CVT26_013102 [Gymnopilus dilepis]